ncbi:MAG: tetratricopeptide repeat protein [Gemmatimonadetes bacterium]|nr:tetratricopeptide repeat protein [Gemmatimonadota bacterium]NIO30682.1 tetratricopeptide repeat protein [Gemmatimonadota bacterium]
MARRLALGLIAWLLLAAGAAAQTDEQRQGFREEMRRIESLERAGQLSRAQAALDTLLEEFPAEPRAVAAAVRIHRRQGDLRSVLAVLERAVKVAPASAVLRQLQLGVLVDLGAKEQLREAGEAWLGAVPRSEAAYREYGMALRREGSLVEAERVLRRGLDSVGDPTMLASELADIYVQQRRWALAADLWVVILDFSPRVGRDVVGYQLDTLGPDARPAARALLARLPEKGPAEQRELMAITALHAGVPGVARQMAQALAAELEGRERQEFLARFSEVATDLAQPALLDWAYREMLGSAAADTSRWDVARRLVEYDLSVGDTVEASGALDDFMERAAAGTPPHRWASALLIRIQAAAGQADARQMLEDHARIYQDDDEFPALVAAVAWANLQRGQPEEAAGVLELVSDPGADPSVATLFMLTGAYLAFYSGDYEEARVGFEVAAARLSGAARAEALRTLGFLRHGNAAELRAAAAAHRGNLGQGSLEAHEELVRGLQQATTSPARPALLLWAGELAIAGGSLDGAETVLRRLAERYPESGEAPVAMMLLAEALAVNGRRAAAIALLEELIIEYPESALTPIGRRRLAELREEVPGS